MVFNKICIQWIYSKSTKTIDLPIAYTYDRYGLVGTIYHGSGTALGTIQYTGRGITSFYATIRYANNSYDDYASYITIGY